jgi:hypothetical protein
MDGSSLLQALWNWILMRLWTSTLGRHRPGALSGIRLANSWRLAGSRSIEGVIDMARAEAQALWDGLLLGWANWLHSIYIESDSLEVVEAVREPNGHRIVGMTFLDECRAIVVGFVSTRLSHCPREANKVANVIANL